jgi:hypothetical protein
MLINWSCLCVNIGDSFEIFGLFEKKTVRLALSVIPCYGRADSLSSEIYSTLESDITSKIEMLLSECIKFRFWDIYEFIEREEDIFWLVSSTEL